MIQLHPDCLMFEMADGEAIPCAVDLVAVELMGEGAAGIDPDLVRNAARAVLHYFKVELERNSVSVSEFFEALARVLRGFGLTITSAHTVETPRRIFDSDLRQLASASGTGFELAFFPRLRDELNHRLTVAPDVIRFTGLRSCVKQLAGARRWTGRCQQLNDQIVEYLRHCLTTRPSAGPCSLMVF